MVFYIPAKGEYSFEIGGQLNLGAGSSEFAPFYLHSNNHGKITQSKNAQIDLWALDTLDLTKRFDFAWGVEALAGYANKADYARWDKTLSQWYDNPQGPAAIWLQQLYGEVKWRCLYLRLGLKDLNSCFVNQELSSGDLLWSGNSRGIPEVRIGFVDFQDVPFTKKWVQADVCLSYGKFMDANWVKNHFDYYRGSMNPDPLWTYKKLALRTNPEKPFMFHAGIQMATLFGGTTEYYGGLGQLDKSVNNYTGFKDFIQVLLPFWTSSTEGYRVGDTKGTWDFAARYRFKTGETLKAYVQWLWEDSSGIPKKNGFDGLWGLEFQIGRKWWITGVVAEYLDLTHMSGPILYDPTHATGTPLPGFAGGVDSYYNNWYYRAYVNYGLNIGSPMVQGTLFQTGENSPEYVNNGAIPYFRVRGFHIAVQGNLSNTVSYIVKYNHRKAWGSTNTFALIRPIEADSFMAGVDIDIKKVPGMTITGNFGFDRGKIPGNSCGALVTLTYVRPILFK